jgi:hypothetical protein
VTDMPARIRHALRATIDEFKSGNLLKASVQMGLFTMFAYLFFETIGKNIKSSSIVDTLRVITASTVALAAVMFSLYRALDGEEMLRARIACRTAGRRFLIATVVGIIYITTSELQIILHTVGFKSIDFLFRWIAIYSSGFLVAYAAYGVAKIVEVIMLIPSSDTPTR